MQRTDVKVWCDEVAKRMLKVMSNSNIYESLATMYFDLVVFGTAPIIIYDDKDTVIRAYNPCAGEYYLITDATLRVSELNRKFKATLNQIVGYFGLKALSPQMRDQYKNGGAATQYERVVAHAIEPNIPLIVEGEEPSYPVPKTFKYREVYWIFEGDAPQPLACKGYHENPFVAIRWDTVSNDPYGRSPGMDALGDVQQLQLESREKAKSLQKVNNPPLLGDVSLKNEPLTSPPGGITFVNNLKSDTGLRPVYMVQPDIPAITADIKEVQERIKNIFYNDLFLMISQLDTVRSATEIDARQQEKLVQIGPVIERIEGEGLDKIIHRIFNIMNRQGLLPPAPPDIHGLPIDIHYISILAEAQRAAATAAIERVLQVSGQLAGAVPDIMDNIDADEALDEYADLLHVPAKIIRDKNKVAQIRAARAKQQQQAQLLQQTLAGAKGAKDLSDTDVGGGQNALQKIVGV